MDDVLRDMTFKGASLEQVRTTALASRKLKPLIADGARKVLAGVTHPTEVLRVTRASEA
jgi:type II secretory ATPase GspE/PulE/Tfp pilus assembly ATPase PilB-like protein